MPLLGAVEAGGTKFVCAVGTAPDDLRAETRFPTTTPAETLARTIGFFQEQTHALGPLAAIGIGSFGPVDPSPGSPTFGHITSTPKAGWEHIDLAGTIGQALGLPIGFDTDANAAALAEHCWGAARGLDNFVYLTVGTGVGGGGMANGQLLHGLVHPEMGHLRIPHDWQADPYPGWCPYHGDCLEGLANGPAIEARWGQRGETLPPDHPAWALEARYLALGLVAFICTLSPQRIILGGGVMCQSQLFPLIRCNVQELLNGYIRSPAIMSGIDSYIVPPRLGNRAGVLGGLALAEIAARGGEK